MIAVGCALASRRTGQGRADPPRR